MAIAQLALNGFAFSQMKSQGISQEAEKIDSNWDELLSRLRQSHTVGELPFTCLKNLHEAVSNAKEEDWDGYGGQAVDVLTSSNAKRFIFSLPSTIPVPEISIEPDGEIAFEWYLGSHWVLSASIGLASEINYAGLLGTSKIHGVEHFDDEFPQVLVDNLFRLFDNAPESFASK